MHPVMAGVDLLRCDIHHCESRRRGARGDRGLRRGAPGPARGSSAAAGRWRTTRTGRPDPADARRGRARPPGLPAQPRRARRVGQHPRARDRRDHAATRRIPPTAGSSASPTATPPGRCTRAPDTCVDHAAPVRHAGRAAAPACAWPQDYLFSLGHHRWQDAAVGAMFGQTDILPVYLDAARVGRAEGPRRRRRCGGTATRSSDQIADLVERRGAGASAASVRRRVKIMLDGVAENFTAAMLEPYEDGCGCRDAERRSGLRRPRGPARVRHPARRRRVPGALPRARRPCRAPRARRARGGARRERPDRRPPPPGPPAGRAPRRRAALRQRRRHREHPAALGGPRASDGRAHHPVPRRAQGRVAVPVRRPRCAPAPARRRAATGRCRAPTLWTASTSR